MQVLVLYFSKGGNTKKLARAIAAGVEEVSGVTAVMKSVDHVTSEDFISADGVIAGSPVYFGSATANMKALMERAAVAMTDMLG